MQRKRTAAKVAIRGSIYAGYIWRRSRVSILSEPLRKEKFLKWYLKALCRLTPSPHATWRTAIPRISQRLLNRIEVGLSLGFNSIFLSSIPAPLTWKSTGSQRVKILATAWSETLNLLWVALVCYRRAWILSNCSWNRCMGGLTVAHVWPLTLMCQNKQSCGLQEF